MTARAAVRSGAAIRLFLTPAELASLWWMDWARCAETDPDLFFPEKGETARPAKRICRSCGVQQHCLDFALRTEQEHGVFGGLSAPERRRLKRAAA